MAISDRDVEYYNNGPESRDRLRDDPINRVGYDNEFTQAVDYIFEQDNSVITAEQVNALSTDEFNEKVRLFTEKSHIIYRDYFLKGITSDDNTLNNIPTKIETNRNLKRIGHFVNSRAPSNTVVLQTLEFYSNAIFRGNFLGDYMGGKLRIVNDNIIFWGHDGDENVEYKPYGFSFKRPSVSKDPVTTMSIQLDNIDDYFKKEFFKIIKEVENNKVTITYREYIRWEKSRYGNTGDFGNFKNNKSIQKSNLKMFVKSFSINNKSINITCSVPTLKDKKMITEKYTKKDFPSLKYE